MRREKNYYVDSKKIKQKITFNLSRAIGIDSDI